MTVALVKFLDLVQVCLLGLCGLSFNGLDQASEVQVLLDQVVVVCLVITGVFPDLNCLEFEVFLKVGPRFIRFLQESLVEFKIIFEIVKDDQFFVEAN